MIDGIIEFYKKGQHGDMLFFKRGGFWSGAWTVAPHDPSTALSIAKQYVAMKSDGLRHAERVVLESEDGSREDAVAITDLPLGRQSVYLIADGEERHLFKPVRTAASAALEEAIQALNDLSRDDVESEESLPSVL